MYKRISQGKVVYFESVQKKHIMMAFSNLNKEINTVTDVFFPVLCRDFFGDCLYAEATPCKTHIYGFSYDPEIKKIDRDKTRLTVEFPSKEVKEIFNSNLSILYSIENQNKLMETHVEEIDEKTL